MAALYAESLEVDFAVLHTTLQSATVPTLEIVHRNGGCANEEEHYAENDQEEGPQ